MQCKGSMDLQFCMSEEHFSLDILVPKLDRYQTNTNELEKLLVEAGGGLRAGQHRRMRRRTGTRRRLRAVCRAAAAVPVARRQRPLPCDTPIAKEYFELCGRIIDTVRRHCRSRRRPNIRPVTKTDWKSSCLIRG